jgi:hypothetical protein
MWFILDVRVGRHRKTRPQVEREETDSQENNYTDKEDS